MLFSFHGTKETYLKCLMQIMETSEFSPFSPVLPFKFNTRQFLHKTLKLEIIWFVLLDF